MVIHVSVQYNGGLLPDIILLLKTIICKASELLSLQPMFPVGVNIQICVHNISIIFVCACTPGLVF